jgi:hypothetical protein
MQLLGKNMQTDEQALNSLHQTIEASLQRGARGDVGVEGSGGEASR